MQRAVPEPQRNRTLVVGLLASVIVVAAGAAVRAWLLGHSVVNSDEAVVGLMAEQVRHGSFFTFYWGQAYGGVEFYLVAVLFSLFGATGVVVKSAPVLLYAASAVLVWRIALRMLADRRLAVIAGLVVWIWPTVLIQRSTIEDGFRGVTLAAGLGCLLAALRIADGSSRLADFAVLGLLAGIGWWASPEIVYLLLPAGLLLLGSILRRSRAPRPGLQRRRAVAGSVERPSGKARDVPATDLLVCVLGFLVGALPWLYTNVRAGFPSLSLSSGPITTPSSYADRLSAFHDQALPLVFGLRLPLTGEWLPGPTAGHALLDAGTVVLSAAVVVGLSSGGRRAALAASVLAFPFLYAALPTTIYSIDGRYAVYLVPLEVLVTLASAEMIVSRSRNPSRRTGQTFGGGALVLAASISVAVLGASTLAGFGRLSGLPVSDPARYAAGWGDNYSLASRAVATIRSAGVDAAWADYWTSYNLDLVGRQAVTISPVNSVRSLSLYDRVLAARDPGWLFISPRDLDAAAIVVTGDPGSPGPGGMTEQRFLGALGSRHIGYRVVHAGPLDAVVPARRVTPAQMGLPYSFA